LLTQAANVVGDVESVDCVLTWILVTSGITSDAAARGSIQRVLLLGPDDDARRALHVMLAGSGKQVAAMTELDCAKRYLATNECDAVIAPSDVATELATIESFPAVIALVRPRDVSAAVSLLAAGVHEVVSEPVDELAVTLALRNVALRPKKTASASKPPASRATPDGAPPVTASPLIGTGEAMEKLRTLIEQVAKTRSTVLILGESGTGKELVARAIHDTSPRRGRRFVAINCAAIPAALLESELFGHLKGSFTDASRDKTGLFEDADGGTLFLDEIGELPLPLQAKLLRALQEGEIRRIGDNVSTKVDVRLIAATLRDLADDVEDGRFREDLFYRLNVLPVKIPPLRDRADDIPLLARFFAERHAVRHDLDPIELTARERDRACAGARGRAGDRPAVPVDRDDPGRAGGTAGR
jgi:two-component system, NtrC family, response regulator AtoC